MLLPPRMDELLGFTRGRSFISSGFCWMPGRWDISVRGRLEIFAAKYIASLSVESLLCCALRKAVAAEGSKL